ncbi:MAG TPA: bifunctional UDP-2,4-diacetamido-2,4,6-trideoxy-beta-L-altropyranose hydrolase/GNAT family N-acetyltransferase [Candidatus Omnitrophota bacterium]|nr:bifunctional UDP-2,4-diacetamido-2,4,6-trideoxy-beta-L-altropyranose hydrolase/GNAT family N-acetyltransferase [Candidatus Omnitrophota bacterium]
MRLRAVIFTEGGKRIGFGHITRCIALRDALTEIGIDAFLFVNGDNSARRQFGKQLNSVFDWLKDQGRVRSELKKADIVIVDSYLAPRSFYKNVSEQVPVPVFLDDFKRLAYPEGIILNGAIGTEKLRYGFRALPLLLGSRFALLRKNFWKVGHRTVRTKFRDLLLTFGGMERTGFIQQLLTRLSLSFPQYRFHVITAYPFPNKRAFPRAHFYRSLSGSQIKALMLRCDAAISGGGQTTNELAACGLPVIGVRFASNQRLNLLGWRKTGLLKEAGSHEDPKIIGNIALLLHRLDHRSRSRMSRAGQKAVDGRGALRSAKALCDAVIRFQPVRAADRALIYHWSSAPEVRAVSFHSAQILWKEHCRWFNEKLRDPDCLFLKAVLRDRTIGQIRFDARGERATISVVLAPQYRGKGLAARVLRAAVHQVLRTRSEIKMVDAFIKKENHASVKAFQKAGFRPLNIKNIHGQEAWHFVQDQL